jgi:hypothetical protein
MRALSACLILVAITLGPACTDDHGIGDARARWTKQGPANYRFMSTRTCFCPTEITRPMQIDVASRQLIRAVYVDDQQPVSDSYRPQLWTVDQAFDVIQSAIDQGADHIEAHYDPALGYPTSVGIDYEQQSSDGGIMLQLSGVTPTAP